METGERIRKLDGDNRKSQLICLSPIFKQIACIVSGMIKIFDTDTGKVIYSFEKHDNWASGSDISIHGICCSPNDKHIISARTSDRIGTITIRNTDTGCIIKIFKYYDDIGKMQSRYANGINKEWDAESSKLIHSYLTRPFGIYTMRKSTKPVDNSMN